MNEIIVLNRDEFISIINEISYKAGKASATEVLAQIEKKQDDKISKEEALSLLRIKPDKLAKMRENREIIYYGGTRPYMYSRQSIEEYLTRTTISSSKLIKNST
jgi:transcription elongation factor GreA-like protein